MNRSEYIHLLKTQSFVGWEPNAIKGYLKAIEIIENKDDEFIKGFFTATTSIIYHVDDTEIEK